jgi:hypothetical protein
LVHKVYIKGNNTLDLCEKTLLFSNYQMGFFKHIGDILYVANFVKNMLSISQLIEQVFNVEFETNFG